MLFKVFLAVILSLSVGTSLFAAKERPIMQLPKDIWNLAFVWTEPIKSVAKNTRQFDPVSGLWFGLVDGSVRSVERTTEFFLGKQGEQESVDPNSKGKNPLLKYSF